METNINTEQALSQMIVGSWITQAVYVAAELGIADRLAAGPRSADDLARELGAHAGSLYRLLRALGSVGIFSEDDAGRFSATALGRLLGSDVPGSKRSLARMSGAEFYRSWGDLLHSVATGGAAFDQAFGGPFFGYMSAHPERWRIYDEAMTGIHDSETLPVLEAYDFSSFETVVDVGGGNGSALAAILRQNPRVRGVLFDLPAVVERARDENGLGDRLRRVGGDFFVAVPPGGDAYLMRHVIHDWQDDDAVAVLARCREAMTAKSRVLVVETVIPSGNEPCFGKLLDLMMLVVGGRERTREHYERLFSAAGLRLTRVIPTAHEVSVIEGTRAP